jgi:aminoglycoside phosphotransferase (APT) family kinase protein
MRMSERAVVLASERAHQGNSLKPQQIRQRMLVDRHFAAIWEQALALPDWDGPDTWIHSDHMPGNLITRNGRLAAVIDFDGACIGDPSEDLTVAWMVLPSSVRAAFRQALAIDDATWLRARARAIAGAMGGMHYYGDGLNPAMYNNSAYHPVQRHLPGLPQPRRSPLRRDRRRQRGIRLPVPGLPGQLARPQPR